MICIGFLCCCSKLFPCVCIVVPWVPCCFVLNNQPVLQQSFGKYVSQTFCPILPSSKLRCGSACGDLEVEVLYVVPSLIHIRVNHAPTDLALALKREKTAPLLTQIPHLIGNWQMEKRGTTNNQHFKNNTGRSLIVRFCRATHEST